MSLQPIHIEQAHTLRTSLGLRCACMQAILSTGHLPASSTAPRALHGVCLYSAYASQANACLEVSWLGQHAL
jgi:hypothetical protein